MCGAPCGESAEEKKGLPDIVENEDGELIASNFCGLSVAGARAREKKGLPDVVETAQMFRGGGRRASGGVPPTPTRPRTASNFCGLSVAGAGAGAGELK